MVTSQQVPPDILIETIQSLQDYTITPAEFQDIIDSVIEALIWGLGFWMLGIMIKSVLGQHRVTSQVSKEKPAGYLTHNYPLGKPEIIEVAKKRVVECHDKHRMELFREHAPLFQVYKCTQLSLDDFVSAVYSLVEVEHRYWLEPIRSRTALALVGEKRQFHEQFALAWWAKRGVKMPTVTPVLSSFINLVERVRIAGPSPSEKMTMPPIKDNVGVYVSEILPEDIARYAGLHADPKVKYRYTTYYYGLDLSLFQRDLQRLLRERTGIPYLMVDAYYIRE